MSHAWGARSIRVRLALCYATALAVVLTLYAGGVFLFFGHSLYADLDRDLRDDVEVAEGMLQRDPTGRITWRSAPDADDEELMEGRWLEVLSPAGEILYSRPRPIPRHGRVDRLSESGSVDGVPIVIVAARSEKPVRRQLAELLFGMAVALPLAAVVAGLGGYALASRVLRPLTDMVERARAITAEHLGERLVTGNNRDELGQLAAVFNDMLTRLQRSFDQLRRFTADASHELRTPLAAIRAVGEVALHEPRKDQEYREVIGSMLEEVDRLGSVLEGLLTLSRADSGNIVLQRERVDLTELARDVASHLGVLAEEKRQTIALVAREAVDIHADRLTIRRALVNLVDNAIKYTPEGGSIGIIVGSESGKRMIEVVDTGPGIPEGHRERIFDRFYRVDEARSRNGTGLGLPIARWAVEANGGRIEVDQPDGPGSIFRILFPADSHSDPARWS